jgi:hypothetical protein
MGGPIEGFIEPLAERILARLFPVFKDRNEIKIGMNHFLTHFWITGTLSLAGWYWAAIVSVVLVAVAEYKDVQRGRWVDVWTRSAGWVWGVWPSMIKWI